MIESNETLLAVSNPDPATAGTPMPYIKLGNDLFINLSQYIAKSNKYLKELTGKHESPVTRRPFTGVVGNGNEASPALIAGP